MNTLQNLALENELSHYELAEKVEALGFEVVVDSDDNERSFIFMHSIKNEDGSEICVGEIVGDSVAKIVLSE